MTKTISDQLRYAGWSPDSHKALHNEAADAIDELVRAFEALEATCWRDQMDIKLIHARARAVAILAKHGKDKP